MGALGTPATAGESLTTVTGERSSPEGMRVIDYPDGRMFLVDEKIMAEPGETPRDALARSRRLRIAELFDTAAIPARFSDWSFETFGAIAEEHEEKVPALGAAFDYAASGGRRTNLLLVGPTGTGKTGLAVCILKARVEAGVPSLFVSVSDLLDKIRATYGGTGDYTQLMEAVKTIDFLVLDDLGAHYATEWASEKLFQLLGYRHDWMLPVVATTDRPLGELETSLGRRTLARLLEDGIAVEVGGKDLRR
jgi:DNA replication protein DnaC